MVSIDITEDEAKVLHTVIDSYLSDLRMEIADTDRKDFRDMLKHRKQVLIKVLGELSTTE